MKVCNRRAPWLALLLLAVACDEPPPPKKIEGLGAMEDRSGPQLAVINSDWFSTSISLLGIDGKVLADDYLNSGSAPSGLVTALSGDVELPTRSNDPGVLVVVDRFRTDVITRIRLADGAVLGQVKTHTPPAQSTMNAYTSNPYDYIRIDDETAWVTRYEPNLDPSVPVIDRGNDLLRINPTKMERTDERIDLSSLDGVSTRTDPGTGRTEEVKLYARPGRMVRIGGALIVGLGNSSYDFMTIGPGAVAIIDLTSKRAESFALEGLTGCGHVDHVPGHDDLLLVGCAGTYRNRRQTAGAAIVRVEEGRLTVQHRWRAQDHAEVPPLSASFVAISETVIAAAANDDASKVENVFGTLNLETGLFTTLLTASTADGTFGTAQRDHQTGTLFVPDASLSASGTPVSGVRVLQAQPDGSFVETDTILTATRTAMPVRHVFRL